MKTSKVLQVSYKERLVGTLALTKEKQIAFEYDDAWLDNGFSISPFSLPLEKKVFIPSKNYFNGLYGVFADSLPDAWGKLLLDRLLLKNNVKLEEISTLDRLAIIGSTGMGGLDYFPEHKITTANPGFDLDFLAFECKKILESEYYINSEQNSENIQSLDALYALGGSSGGARPKVMMEIDGVDWIIKFPARGDSQDVGKREYEYSLCAKDCGIDMTQTKLFPSEICAGYFGVERFDRVKTQTDTDRIHVLTVAALLELNFEQPSLDYSDLMKLTKILTKDNIEHLENMFRRACFNVFAHNRDDHSKNFSFLYNEIENRWHLAPAYDLTFSTTFYGEHTTSVNGNGKDPGEKELLQVGVNAGLNRSKCLEIIDEIKLKTKVLVN